MSQADDTLQQGAPYPQSGIMQEEDKRELLRRWARMGPVFIMIVALFGFGLHYEAGQQGAGEITIRWSEVPAILIVFILAELGVRLVQKSSEIGDQVESSANTVAATVDVTKKLQVQNQVLLDAVDRMAGSFGSISEISTLMNSPLYKESIRLRARLGIEFQPFWDKLGIFVKSWAPTGPPASEKSGKLLFALLDAYVGKDTRDGAVRSDLGAVKCITSDSVYAEASETWLRTMLDDHEDDTVVVWAVTTLLPSEFALPDLWLSGSGGTVTTRSRALNRFVDAVIERCQTSAKGRLQYRRVTVFDKSKALPYYVHEHAPHKTSRLADTLDHWWIWDPRIRPFKDVLSRKIADVTHALLKQTGRSHSGWLDELSWDELHKLCSIRTKYAEAYPYRERILPAPMLETKDGELRLRRFGADEGGEKLVLSCDTSALAALIPRPTELLKDQPEEVQEALRPLCITSPTLRIMLEALGWRSLRDWYCGAVHTDDEAWWAVKRGDQFPSKFSDEFFQPLELTWNGTKVLTLDVLLIGAKANKPQATPTWYGAVVSNISFNRTECTVDLKLNQAHLAEIAKNIEEMCSEGDHSGRWRTFNAITLHP